MKKSELTLKMRRVLFGLVFFVCFSIAQGCGEKETMDPESTPEPVMETEPTPQPKIKNTVRLAEKDEIYKIISENPVETVKGEKAVFLLEVQEGYKIENILYRGVTQKTEIIPMTDGTTKVEIYDIGYSCTVEAEYMETEVSILYYPNGGEYTNGDNSLLPYSVAYSLKRRLRPNTEIGADRLSRTGYVFNGWNTDADGNGQHIGSGSRVTVKDGTPLSLYAQWEKCSDSSLFITVPVEGGLEITEYTGNESKVVVPENIGGELVISIGKGAFSGEIREIVLPYTIQKVEAGAFRCGSLKEIYFFDHIMEISDAAFEKCEELTTVHINAYEKPRYNGTNLFSEVNLADKYDLLIMNADKRKIIVYGGSGAYNSVNTNQMENTIKNSYGEDYLCLNMAVNGWFNGAAQMDMLMAYMNAGDIFIHVPETSSMFSFLYSVSMIPEITGFTYNKLRFYCCVESNYDLFSLVDISHVEYFFDGFCEFNKERMSLPESSYETFKESMTLFGYTVTNNLGYMDERGNMISQAMDNPVVTVDVGEADIVPEYVLDDAANKRLNAVYDGMTEKGIKVFFITAPVNKVALATRLNNPDAFSYDLDYLFPGRPAEIALTYKNLSSWVKAFDDAVYDKLQCVVLRPLSDTLYDQSMFLDADYHLNKIGAKVYTDMIITELMKRLKGA